MPTISGYQSENGLFVGEGLTVNCKSCAANPAPTLTWKERSNSNILETTSTQLADGCTSLDLTIAAIGRADHAKIFDCIVDNAVGAPASDSVTLNIHGEGHQSFNHK